jgi:hypothetical protein
MLADHKQENTVFKANLRNIGAAFLVLKDSLTVWREREMN